MASPALSLSPAPLGAARSAPAAAVAEASSSSSSSTAVTEKDLQTLQEFIENALDLLLKGNSTNYQYLIRQLSSGKAHATSRRKIFLALPRCISSMAKEPKAFHQLLDVLFKFDFLVERDEVDAYTSFIVHLVSSNTVYVLPTLQMLVRNLCRPQKLPPHLAEAVAAAEAAAAPPPSSSSTAAGKIKIGGSFGVSVASSFLQTTAAPTAPVAPVDLDAIFQQRYDDVHKTLQRVLQLVPTAANALFPVVVEHFPHKRLDAPFQVAYLQNVLTLSLAVPGLQERIFGLIIDRLVAVDVEIKLDEKEEDVFTMDDFLDDELLPDDNAKVDEMADKLDHMMVLMFEHIERLVRDTSSSSSASLNATQAALVFKCLLKVFEHSILNTHRSKYPQFLLFFVCQLDPQFQDVFISQLLAASLDPQTPPVTRHSCGAYLASFLARAKYIPVSYLHKALFHLLKWMHDQMDVYDATYREHQRAAAGDATALEAATVALEQQQSASERSAAFHESIFISTLQTVCYLVCFRGLEVAQSDGGYEFLRSLGWERLLITPTGYCPLAFCQQTVATEFLNFVETFDLVSDDCIEKVDQAITTMSRMQRSQSNVRRKTMERTAPPPPPSSGGASMPASISGSSVLGLRQPLETFFPFDPYLLRRSFRFIGPLYLYWKHADPTSSENADALNAVKEIIRAYQEEEEEDDDEDDDDDDDDDDLSDDEDGAEAMSLSGSVTMASFKEESYLSTREQSYSVSMESSFDDDESLTPPLQIVTRPASASSRLRRAKRISRTTFAPSPALSASSPPSQLPPLGGFALGGFDNEPDDDEGF
ncbi:hypothetical protein PINS_up009890 [Pythium insidiosum]|nr:hypothetical protein PINS_up009890 [Pythium insidiosum]